MAEPESEVKHIAEIVGGWGKWQFQFALYVFLWEFNTAFINMGYMFYTKKVDFWCSDVPEREYQNITKSMQCFSYENSNESCTQWQYNTTQYKKSIFIEFDLVCDRAYYTSLTQTCYQLGYMMAGLVTAQLSDKYGRRPMIWMSITVEIFGVISCGLSFNIYQYLISRFFVGFANSGGGWAMETILIECCGPKLRSDVIFYTEIGWVLGYVVMPGLAYLLQDFQYLHLITAITLVLFLIRAFFISESPRWQMNSGQTDKAEITIRNAIKINGLKVEDLEQKLMKFHDNLQRVRDSNEGKKSHNLLDLLKTPNIRKYSLIIWYSVIVNGLIYYGFSLNMSEFGGNFYITFMLAGLVELPHLMLTPLLLRFIGRRKLHSAFMLILVVSSFAIIPSRAEWLKVMFALIGKLGVSASWMVLNMRAAELYPTVIRNTGRGISSLIARFGSASAPFMGDLANYTGLAFVMGLYGTLSAISAILSLYLPETKDREIPDTIEESENFQTIQMKEIGLNSS